VSCSGKARGRGFQAELAGRRKKEGNSGQETARRQKFSPKTTAPVLIKREGRRDISKKKGGEGVNQNASTRTRKFTWQAECSGYTIRPSPPARVERDKNNGREDER